MADSVILNGVVTTLHPALVAVPVSLINTK